jgi:hypothetical protein
MRFQWLFVIVGLATRIGWTIIRVVIRNVLPLTDAGETMSLLNLRLNERSISAKFEVSSRLAVYCANVRFPNWLWSVKHPRKSRNTCGGGDDSLRN